LLGLGGYLVIDNQLSLGQLVAAEIVLGALIYAFKRFAVLLESYYDLMAAAAKIDTVLYLPTEQLEDDLAELFIPIEHIAIKIPHQPQVQATVGQPLCVTAGNADVCKTLQRHCLASVNKQGLSCS